jgi:FMN reductase
MATAPEILVLCGSLRENSSTHKALEAAAAGAREAGAAVVWADPWMGELPPFSEGNEAHPAVRELLRAAQRAGGFLWGSPEYHGSCSGLLKNALDHLTFSQTEGKVAALVATAGGAGGAAGTLITLRTVARNLHLWTLPAQVSASSADLAPSGQGGWADPGIRERLRSLGRELVEAVLLLGWGRAPR